MEILAGVQACQDKPFSALENLVMGHGTELSGCLCVLLDWNEDRQKFVRKLQQMQIPVKVALIVRPEESDEPLPGVMVDDLDNFHVIPSNKVATGLKNLT